MLAHTHDVHALVNTADVHGVTPLHVCTDVRHKEFCCVRLVNAVKIAIGIDMRVLLAAECC